MASQTTSQRRYVRNQPCDLCGGGRFDVVAQLDRRGHKLTTVVCRQCGLVSHGRIPSDAQLAEYYGKKYRRDYHGETAPSAHRVIRAWKNGRRIFGRLEEYLRRGDRVFEIGAGIGCTVRAFEMAGFRASGIEPGEGFHAFSTDQLCTTIENVNLADLKHAATYDLVLLIHVIEHFNSPSKALRHIHRLLKPGGRLYVECPNVLAPHAAPLKLFHFAHVHNFTPKTLGMMAQACGFAIQKQLSGDRDKNLMMLLTRRERAELCIDSESYASTMEALTRYSTLGYHLRWRYLRDRLQTVTAQLSEHVMSKWRLARIVRQCKRHAQQQEAANIHTASERRAA